MRNGANDVYKTVEERRLQTARLLKTWHWHTNVPKNLKLSRRQRSAIMVPNLFFDTATTSEKPLSDAVKSRKPLVEPTATVTVAAVHVKHCGGEHESKTKEMKKQPAGSCTTTPKQKTQMESDNDNETVVKQGQSFNYTLNKDGVTRVSPTVKSTESFGSTDDRDVGVLNCDNNNDTSPVSAVVLSLSFTSDSNSEKQEKEEVALVTNAAVSARETSEAARPVLYNMWDVIRIGQAAGKVPMEPWGCAPRPGVFSFFSFFSFARSLARSPCFCSCIYIYCGLCGGFRETVN